jgi:hypothetical protein
VGGEGTNGKEGEGRRLQRWYMVDGLHIPIWNRTKKPLAIALSGAGRVLRGRDDGTYNVSLIGIATINIPPLFIRIMNIF